MGINDDEVFPNRGSKNFFIAVNWVVASVGASENQDEQIESFYLVWGFQELAGDVRYALHIIFVYVWALYDHQFVSEVIICIYSLHLKWTT